MARINASSEGVRVEGLNELNRALREMGPDFQKQLRETNKDVAEFVADDARSAAYSIGGVAAKAAPSIRASGTNTRAGVAFGGAAYPFAGGAEFGSVRYKQFKPWRGSSSDAGYFLYPAIRHDADRITTQYTEAINKLMKRNGLA